MSNNKLELDFSGPREELSSSLEGLQEQLQQEIYGVTESSDTSQYTSLSADDTMAIGFDGKYVVCRKDERDELEVLGYVEDERLVDPAAELRNGEVTNYASMAMNDAVMVNKVSDTAEIYQIEEEEIDTEPFEELYDEALEHVEQHKYVGDRTISVNEEKGPSINRA